MEGDGGGVGVDAGEIGEWGEAEDIRGGGSRGPRDRKFVDFPDEKCQVANVLREGCRSHGPEKGCLYIQDVLDLRLLGQHRVLEALEDGVVRVDVALHAPLSSCNVCDLEFVMKELVLRGNPEKTPNGSWGSGRGKESFELFCFFP